MKAGNFLTEVNNINGDVEVAIAKILMKNKDLEDALHIGYDENNVRCVLMNDVPIRKFYVEDNIKLLEELENKLEY